MAFAESKCKKGSSSLGSGSDSPVFFSIVSLAFYFFKIFFSLNICVP